MIDGDNKPLSEIFRDAAEEWVDLEAAAQLLEDSKSSLLAQKCAALGDMAVNKAEQAIKSSRDWQEHIQTIVEARKRANQAKLNLEYIRMRFNEWQNKEANNRVEARL